MYRLLSILLLACSVRCEHIIIGGIFDTENDFHEKVFENTAKAINREGVLPPDKELLPMIKKVPPGDNFSTINELCEMLGLGAVGIFGPISGTTSRMVQSVCDAKDVPHIEMRSDSIQKRGDCHVNFYPHPKSLAQAYVDLIQTYEWKSFTILYENNNNLYRLAQVMEMYHGKGYTITLRQLDLGVGTDYRSVLYLLKKSSDKHILLDCSLNILPDVLTQAQQVGLISEEYNIIITNLDMHAVNMEPFQYGETNITGFRLVDPKDPRVIQTVEYWNDLKGENDENRLVPEYLTVDAALLVDSMYTFASVLKELNFSKYINNVFDCDDDYPWEYGSTVTNFIKTNHMKGLTKDIRFDNEGLRTEFTMDIIELTNSGLKKVGTWDPSGVKMSRYIPVDQSNSDLYSLTNKTLRVITAISPPYGMLKESADKLEGNDRYEGFGIELIDELSKLLNFNYTFSIQEDGAYGSYNEATKEWNGMIRKLMDDEVDLAITDLTVTEKRESAVDFTMPFMNLGISILYKKATKQPPKLFSFMAPFSNEVWLYLGSAYLGVSLLIFVLARISPKEWNNPYPCIEEPEILINQFSLPNSLWFTVGSVLQQGSELAPIAISTRMMAGIWWFFTLIMVSSYTANLAAFLTVESLTSPIYNADDLAKQNAISYGAKKGGSTASFFAEQAGASETYRIMNDYMESHPSNMPSNNDDGVNRVKTSNYAFLMESTSIEYIIERNCELDQIGGLLDDKGYAIAMKKNSPYRNALSEAVLKLQEQGKLTSMKRTWWKEKRGGGACQGSDDSSGGAVPLGLPNVGGVFLLLIVGVLVAVVVDVVDMLLEVYHTAKREQSVKSDQSADLGMANVGGVFFVLVCGSLFACLIAIGEMLYGVLDNARSFKVSFREELMEELKFLAHWSGDTKPVRHRSPEAKTPENSSQRSESNKSKDMLKPGTFDIKPEDKNA